MKYIGKGVEFYVNNGVKRVGTIVKVEFHKELGKPVFTIRTPYGNTARLTKDEIHRII